jgi:DNA gyrase subunit A
MRAKTHFEPIGKTDRQAIIVDEIVSGQQIDLLQKIGELVRDKKLEGISTCATSPTSRVCASSSS